MKFLSLKKLISKRAGLCMLVLFCSLMIASFGLGTSKQHEHTEENEGRIAHGIELMKAFISQNLDYLKDKKEDMAHILHHAVEFFDEKWENAKSFVLNKEELDMGTSSINDGPMDPKEVRKMDPDDLVYPDKVDIHDNSFTGKVKDVLSGLKDSVGDKLDKSKDLLKDAGIPDKIGLVGDKLSAGAEAVKSAIPETVKEGFAKVGDTIGSTLDKGKEKIAGLGIGDKISETLHTVSEKVSQGKETLKQHMPGSGTPPSDTQFDTAIKNEKTVTTTIDTDTIDVGTDTIQGKDLKGKISDTLNNLGQKISSGKDTLGATVSEGVSKLGEKLSHGTESLKDTVSSMGDTLTKGKEFITDKTDKLTDKISIGLEKVGLKKKKVRDTSLVPVDTEEEEEEFLPDDDRGVTPIDEDVTGDRGTGKLEDSLLTGEKYLKDKVQEGVDYIKDKKDDLLDAGEGMRVNVREKIVSGKERLRDLKDEMMGEFDEEGTPRLKDRIADKLSEGKEYLKEKKDDLVDTVDEGLNYMRQKKDDIFTVDSMGNVRETFKTAKDYLEESKDDLLDKFEDIGDLADEKKQELIDKAKAWKEDIGENLRKEDLSRNIIGMKGVDLGQGIADDTLTTKIKDKIIEGKDYLKEKAGDTIGSIEEGIDYLKEKKEDLMEDIEPTTDKISRKIKKGYEKGKDFVGEKKDEFADFVGDTADYLKDKKDDFVDNLSTDNIKITKDKIVHRVEEGIDYLKEKKDDIMEDIEPTTDKISRKIKEGYEQGKDWAKEKKDDLVDSISTDTLTNIKDKVVDKAGDAVDYLKEKKDDLADSLSSDTMDNIKATLVNQKDKAVHKIEEGVDYLKEKKDDIMEDIEPTTDKISRKIKEGYEQGKDWAKEKKDDLVDSISTDSLTDIKDKVVDKVGDTVDYLKEKKKDLVEEGSLGDLKESITEKFHEGKEYIEEKFDELHDSWDESKDDLEYVLGKRDDVLGRLASHGIIQDSIDTVIHLKDKFTDTIEEGKDFVKDKLSGVKDKVSEVEPEPEFDFVKMKKIYKSLTKGLIGKKMMKKLREAGGKWIKFFEYLDKEARHHHHEKLPVDAIMDKKEYLEKIIGHEQDAVMDKRQEFLDDLLGIEDLVQIMKEQEIDPVKAPKDELLEQIQDEDESNQMTMWDSSHDEGLEIIDE